MNPFKLINGDTPIIFFNVNSNPSILTYFNSYEIKLSINAKTPMETIRKSNCWLDIPVMFGAKKTSTIIYRNQLSAKSKYKFVN